MIIETDKKIIGRRELVDFPELDIYQIEAKTDTGAYTSAIHCTDIREELLNNGIRVIRVNLLDPSHPSYDHKQLEFKEFSLRDIKNSFGDVQERYVIRTKIRIYEDDIEAEFSLSDRSDMKYPVLIGRALLHNHFIVDVARKNVALKHKNRQKSRINKKKKKDNL